MFNGPENRRHPRVPVARPVRIRTSGGAVVQGRTVNVSVTGVALLYEAPAELGAVLELTFSLPLRGREVEVRERGVAVYNYLTREGYVVGFRFAAPSAEVAATLREFVAFKRSLKDP